MIIINGRKKKQNLDGLGIKGPVYCCFFRSCSLAGILPFPWLVGGSKRVEESGGEYECGEEDGQKGRILASYLKERVAYMIVACSNKPPKHTDPSKRPLF